MYGRSGTGWVLESKSHGTPESAIQSADVRLGAPIAPVWTREAKIRATGNFFVDSICVHIAYVTTATNLGAEDAIEPQAVGPPERRNVWYSCLG